MTALARLVLRLLGPQVGLAAAVVVTVGVLGAQHGPPVSAWLVAVGGGLVVLMLSVTEHAVSLAPLRAVQLPGHVQSRGLPPVSWIRFVGGLFVALLALSALVEGPWLSMVVVALGLAAQGWIVVTGTVRQRHRGAERRALTAALEAYAPRFVLYTGRRNDATYQLTMWLPLLEKLGVPYAVIVRDAKAVDLAARVTGAPVISCPTASDLDCVVVGSIRAAFYVNMIAENTNFVLYRSMTHVYLGHGDSDKELSAHPAHAMFDRIFVAGPAARERYPHNNVLIPDEKFVVIGRPQIAVAQSATGPIGRAAVPTVLLAPTWRGYNSRTTLSSMGSATVLVDALIARGAAVVFRPHPFSWHGREDRAQITAVDEHLRADRAASGRGHVLGSEQREQTVPEVFDLSDALVTDVGSLLVDYFVTEKPYAVVLPVGVDAHVAREQFPTVDAAYLIESAALGDPGRADTVGAWLDDLLGADPLADRRRRVRDHYLGDRPGDEEPFLSAARAIIGRRPPH